MKPLPPPLTSSDDILREVIHDFNNILAVIQSAAELAQSKTTVENPYLTKILSAVCRGFNLTKEFRNDAK
jgi:hypothetical protein